MYLNISSKKILGFFGFLIVSIILATSVVRASGESINKTVSNTESGSTSEAKLGDQLDWVVSYNNGDGSNSSLSIEDFITPNQKFVPGSLQVPQNWNKTYSTDGSTFNQIAEPANAVGVGAFNPLVGSPATSNTNTNNQLPGAAVLNGTGGDGYYPIAYRHSSGKDVLFNIFHYARSNATNGQGGKNVTKALICTDIATGSSCDLDDSGTSEFPKYLSDVNGSDGSNISEANIDTNEMLDAEIVNGKLFFPGQRGTADAGIGCFDVETGKFCGFYPYVTSPSIYTSSSTDITEIEGIKAVGNKIYAYSPRSRQLMCLSATTLTSCGTTSLAGSLEAWSAASSGNSAYATLNTSGDKLFITQYNYMNNPTADVKIACIDTTTDTMCSGWGTSGVVTVTGTNYFFYLFGAFAEGHHSYSFMFNDTGGDQAAICLLAHVNATTGSLKCYKISDGSSYTSPGVTALQTALNNDVPWNNGILSVTKMLQTGIHYENNKMYVPLDIGGGHIGATYCFDFTSEQGCSTFGTNGYLAWGQLAGKEVGGYGYASINGCMFGLGDTAVLWSFNPDDGTTSCNRASVNIEVRSPAQSFYCDGKQHSVNWDKVAIGGIDSNVSSLMVEVYDADNTDVNADPILTSGNILPGNEFSIASLAYGSGPSEYENLRVVVVAEVNNVAIVDEGQYSTTVSFTGDNPQICYSTTVNDDNSLCGTNIINDVNVRQLQDVTSQATIGIVCQSSNPNNDPPTSNNPPSTTNPATTDVSATSNEDDRLADSGQNWLLYSIAGLSMLTTAGGLGLMWNKKARKPVFKS